MAAAVEVGSSPKRDSCRSSPSPRPVPFPREISAMSLMLGDVIQPPLCPGLLVYELSNLDSGTFRKRRNFPLWTCVTTSLAQGVAMNSGACARATRHAFERHQRIGTPRTSARSVGEHVLTRLLSSPSRRAMSRCVATRAFKPGQASPLGRRLLVRERTGCQSSLRQGLRRTPGSFGSPCRRW